MANKDEMLKMLEEEKEIRENRILAEKDGQLFVTFHDASVLNSANAYEGGGTGLQERNEDGSLASTGKRVHAINPDFYFLNRYKLKGNGSSQRVYVVSGHTPEGFRLITEQASGRCFMKTIPVYVIKRNSETKELELEKADTISESEFISDYTKKLSNQAMAEILPLIVDKGIEVSANDMPI